MAPKDRESKRDKSHLSVVPKLEEVQPVPEIPEETGYSFSTSEPEQPVTVQLRVDTRASNYLQALAKHDQTNPAEQYRTALNIYLAIRLGDAAVQDFIAEHQEQVKKLYDKLSKYTVDVVGEEITDLDTPKE